MSITNGGNIFLLFFNLIREFSYRHKFKYFRIAKNDCIVVKGNAGYVIVPS